MKEKWKTLILSIIICVIAGIIGLIGKQVLHSMKFQSLYKRLFVEEKAQVILLGRPTCGFCNLLKPIFEDTTEKYDIEYVYIDTDWLSEKELDKVLEKLDIRKSTFSTPRVLITEDDKIKAHQIGYMDDIELFHFFKTNDLIEKDETFDNPYSNIERISSNDYFNYFEVEEEHVVIIGRIGDTNTNSILEYAQNSNQNDIKYLSPSMLLNDEEQAKFEEFTDIKEDSKLPILVRIKDGVLKEKIEGATKKDFEEFIG